MIFSVEPCAKGSLIGESDDFQDSGKIAYQRKTEGVASRPDFAARMCRGKIGGSGSI